MVTYYVQLVPDNCNARGHSSAAFIAGCSSAISQILRTSAV